MGFQVSREYLENDARLFDNISNCVPKVLVVSRKNNLASARLLDMKHDKIECFINRKCGEIGADLLVIQTRENEKFVSDVLSSRMDLVHPSIPGHYHINLYQDQSNSLIYHSNGMKP